jgi:hypothetical protein
VCSAGGWEEKCQNWVAKKEKKSATGRIEKSKKILAQNEKAFKNMPFHCAWEIFRKKHMDWSGYKR